MPARSFVTPRITVLCVANMLAMHAACSHGVVVRTSFSHMSAAARLGESIYRRAFQIASLQRSSPKGACVSQVRRPLRNVSATHSSAHDFTASRRKLWPARRQRCRAAAEAETTTAEDSAEADEEPPPPGPIPYSEDTETFQDVFAFSGALPEVLLRTIRPPTPV